jgi:hypothetical protein
MEGHKWQLKGGQVSRLWVNYDTESPIFSVSLNTCYNAFQIVFCTLHFQQVRKFSVDNKSQ